MKAQNAVDCLLEKSPTEDRPSSGRPGIYRLFPLKDVSREVMEALLLEAFPQYADHVIDVVMSSYDPNISVGIGSPRKLYGAYFLSHNSVFNAIDADNLTPTEDLTPYKSRKGVEGIALAVAKTHRGKGIASQLKDYPRTLGVDYIFGLQYKELGNLEHWKRRRRVVAESDDIYCTLEDVTPLSVGEALTGRVSESDLTSDDEEWSSYLAGVPDRDESVQAEAREIYAKMIEDGVVNRDNMHEYAEEVARDVVYKHEQVSDADLDTYNERIECEVFAILSFLLHYASVHVN